MVAPCPSPALSIDNDVLFFHSVDAMSKELDRVIGEIDVELDGRVETNTSQETNLGE